MNRARVLALVASLSLLPPAAMAQGDFAKKFFAEQREEALRELEKGNPAEQVKAADRLGVEEAARTAPVLAKHLADADTAVRLAAARTLWTLAGKSPEAFAPARPALTAALDDANAEVAMNAAGALGAMKVPAETLAPARRRVLQQGHPQAYVLFLAARGLVGLDPSASLAPALLDYLEQAASAARRGGSRDNVQLAQSALERLVDTRERARSCSCRRGCAERARPRCRSCDCCIAIRRARTAGRTRCSTWPAPRSAKVASLAWDLLGDQHDAPSVAQWAPRALSPSRTSARWRSRPSTAPPAGRHRNGGTRRALSANASASEKDRLRALEILGRSADARLDGRVPEATAAAKAQWSAACEPTFASAAPGKTLEACLDPLSSAMPEGKERARSLSRWLAANGNPATKVMYLERLEGLWSEAIEATDTVRAELANADPRVKTAAAKALDRIRPAWRESGERQARLANAPAPRAAPSGPAADGAALYDAVRTGDVARVKKLVTRGNVLQPVRFGQMQNPPAPLAIATGYCGIPQVPVPRLAEIVAHLVSLGADPEARDPRGESILDRAKYSCPPEVMKALVGG